MENTRSPPLQSLFPAELDVREGLELASNLSYDILTTGKDKLEDRYETYAPRIIQYIRNHDEVMTSDIAQELDLSYGDTLFILKRLREEGKIVMG